MVKKFLIILFSLSLFLAFSLATVAAEKVLEVWGRASFVDALNTWMVYRAERWGMENGFTVKVTLLPAAEFNTKIVASVAAGRYPDVVINGWPVAEYAEKGLLLPLDDIFQKLDPADLFPVKLNENKVGEQIYGIPMFFEPFVLHIRKDLLKEKGLTYPKDFDELALVAKKLSRPEADFYGLGFTLGRCFDANAHFLAALYTYGGGYLTELSTKGVEIFKREATYKALRWIKDLYEAKAIPPDATGWTDWHNNKNYIEGRIAMTKNPASIYYALMAENPELAAKTALIPVGVTIDGGEESVFVFKATKYPEEAKDLAYSLFKDKEAYRRGIVEGSWTYGLPIFKSQAKIISEQWKKGRWAMWAVDPYQACEMSTHLHSPAAYPYGKATSIGDKTSMGYTWARLLGRVFVDKVPIEQAVEETYKELVEMVKETYGR